MREEQAIAEEARRSLETFKVQEEQLKQMMNREQEQMRRLAKEKEEEISRMIKEKESDIEK